MSTFSVPVVRIGKVGKHPNADTLSITQVDGCPVIFRTGDFQPGDLAIYIPVEAVVPKEVPGTEFLGDHRRIKAKKLRGIFSMGLLLPVTILPLSFLPYSEGQNVATALGITKYEEPEPLCMRTENARAPGVNVPTYDVESYRKFKHLLTPGEEVYISEKIHGANARFVWHDGQLHVGSHNNWKKEDDRNLWWKIAKQYKLAEILEQRPRFAIYGEVYGQVQDLKYDTKPGEVRFAVFDVLDIKTGAFLDFEDFRAWCMEASLPTVPLLYRGPYLPEVVEPQAEGKSSIANNIREGWVLKPVKERWHNEIGRVFMKLISESYLLRKGGTEHH